MQKFNAKTKIISMQEEKLSGNFSPLSSFVQSEITKAQKQNILLFLNKKKESGSLFCKNCNFNDYFEKRPTFCPKCKSTDFYFNALNTESLRDEVQKISKLLTPAEGPLRSEASEARQGRLNPKPNIDIQTASVFYAQVAKKYDLAVYIQPDSLLMRADFIAAENFYSNALNLKKLLRENGTLIVQTYNPSDPTIMAVKNSDFGLLYKNQLEGRRLLSYPPFALLIKITIKGKNAEKTEKVAQKILEDIKSKFHIGETNPLTINHSPLTILGPFKPVFFYKFAQFNIIIKYKLDSYALKDREKAIKTLAYLRKLKDCQIVVEPESMN